MKINAADCLTFLTDPQDVPEEGISEEEYFYDCWEYFASGEQFDDLKDFLSNEEY